MIWIHHKNGRNLKINNRKLENKSEIMIQNMSLLVSIYKE